MKCFTVRTVAAVVMLVLSQGPALGGIYSGPTTQPAFDDLLADAQTWSTALSNKVAEAALAGVNTDYAQVSQVTVNLFKDIFAPWDRANPTDVQAMYDAKPAMGSSDPVGPVGLPFDELADCIEVASNAIDELQQQIDGVIALQDPPDFTSGTVTLNGTHYERNGTRVIPGKFFWQPFDEDIMQAYGRMGEGYYAITDMWSSNVVKSWRYSDLLSLMSSQTAANRVPHQYFLGHTVGSGAWQRTTAPDAFNVGSRLFTHYDIDHPFVRPWLDQLFDKLLDDAVGPSGSGAAPRIHMLANEPVFSIRQGGVDADNNVSSYTYNKFAVWLQTKYGTIGSLNATYGSSHTNFDAAATAYYVTDSGVSTSRQGGPIWYDWCRFNMDRVGDWFTYLKNGVQLVDPSAPTHLKIMGERSIHTAYHDEGLDFEFVTKLVEIPGSDSQMTSLRAEYDNRVEQDWRNRWILEWRAQSITMDFMKSICPEKPYVDLEWHGLSGSRWRDFHMEPAYVRAALWLAATHGLSAINAWVWNREHPSGAIDTRADFIGTTVTQPLQLDAFGRTMKELNAHGEEVTSLVPDQRYYVVYYSKDSAIQDPDYSGEMADVYEALKLLNVPVGFTTPTELGSVSNASQTLVVPPTPFISDADLAALQAFETGGGNMVLVTPSPASQNFSKDELGSNRSSPSFASPTVPLQDVLNMAGDLETALASRKPALPVGVIVTDTLAQPAYGVLSAQSTDPGTQRTVLSLINVSQSQRNVTVLPQPGTGNIVTNLLTGQAGSFTYAMAPQDVLFLSFSPGLGATNPPWQVTYDFASAAYNDGPLPGQDGWVGHTQNTVSNNVLAMADSDWRQNWQTRDGMDAVTNDEFFVSAVFSFSETGPYIGGEQQFFNVQLNDNNDGLNTRPFRVYISRAGENVYAIELFNNLGPPNNRFGYATCTADLLGLDLDADVDLDSDRLVLSLSLTRGATENDWAFTIKLANFDTGVNAITSTGTVNSDAAFFASSTLYGGVSSGQASVPLGNAAVNRVVYGVTIGARAVDPGCPAPTLAILRNGAGVDVVWDSQAGCSYQLQTNGMLEISAGWGDYGVPVAGDGTTMTGTVAGSENTLSIRAVVE